MYQLTLDQYHNKLLITLRPQMLAEDFYRVDEHLRRVVPKMRPGFIVINNITQFEPIDRFPAQIFRESLEYLKDNHVGKIIRVVGGSRQALRFFHQQTQLVDNLNVIYVPTLLDAMKHVPSPA